LVSVMRFVSPGVGIVLGGLFVYAGIQKHLAPYEFAEAILAYQLLPFSLVGLVAAILSWIEIVSGFSLILGCLLGRRRFSNPFPVGGILRRSALLLILGQSVLFIAVLLITLARGLKIDCGCGLLADRRVGPAAILEVALLLGVAGWLYWREGKIGGREEGSLTPVQSKL
jgi:putative oxidoreductase